MPNRPQLKYVVTDQRTGKVIQNAKVYVYETTTTTLIADLFAAPTGGAVIASAELTSNAQGEAEGYPTTPRNFALKITDNGNTAYYAGTGKLVSFPDFTEDPVPAYEDPVEEESDEAALVVALAAKAGTNAAMAVRYVATWGNNSNDGLSWGSAKLTMAAAITALGGPGAVWFSGSFTAPASVPAGVALEGVGAASILTTTLTTSTDAMACTSTTSGQRFRNFKYVASGGTVNGPIGINTNTCADVLIDGVSFAGTFAQAVLVYNGSGVRINACDFNGIGVGASSTRGDAINVFGASSVTITGNTFRDCLQDACYFGAGAKNCAFTGNTVVGSPEGVQIRVSCESIVVTGNSFDITPDGVTNSFGVIVQTDSVDCVVSGNTFRKTAGTGTTGWAVNVDTRSHRTEISHNTIKTGFGMGIAVTTSGGGGTESLDCVVSGNSITGPTTYGVFIGPGETGGVITGNSVIGSSNTGILVVADKTTIVGNKIRANASYGLNVSANDCTVTGNSCNDATANDGILVAGLRNTVTGNKCAGNAGLGINEYAGADYNVIVGNNCRSNSHATLDLAVVGANSKLAYNIGRYTPVGAA